MLVARLREEGGFSVIEGVVAALLLVVGSLAVLGTMDAGTRNTFRAEQNQVAANRLQAELEEIRSIPYKDIAIHPDAVPQASSEPSEPTFRIGQGAEGPTFALNRDGTEPRPMVMYEGSAGATELPFNPGPEPFTSGDVSGHIYRFATYPAADDPDMKRIIVAVQLDDSAVAFSREYQELHTDLVDPDATPAENPLPPGGGTGGTGDGGTGGTEDDGDGGDGAAEFFLTDTPCSFAQRQLVGPDHGTHNTRGRCDQPVSTSTTRGPPDLVFPEVPGPTQEEYNYSQELGVDKGLTMRPVSSSSCMLSYLKVDVLGLGLLDGPLDLDLNNLTGDHQKVHKWVTPPIPSGSSLPLSGDATLSIWTRSLNGASHPGTICVWLFKRMPGEVLGLPIDLPVLPTARTFSCPDAVDGQCSSGWPQQWTELSIPLEDFLATELVAGERFGLAITVSGTSGKNVQFQYDHEVFDSRLEYEAAGVPPF